jgi:predicted dinucleotide-binding enzyme
VVTAFNSIGVEVMANPRFATGQSVLWLSGDDGAACDTVAGRGRNLGFEPVRLGALARACLQEPAALVWITATATLGREFSWGILRR